jgi:hypothetical protein
VTASSSRVKKSPGSAQAGLGEPTTYFSRILYCQLRPGRSPIGWDPCLTLAEEQPEQLPPSSAFLAMQTKQQERIGTRRLARGNVSAVPARISPFPLWNRAAGETHLDIRRTARDNPSKFRTTCCYSKKRFFHRPLGDAKILWSSASSHHKLAIDPKSGHQIPLNFEVESASHGNDACSEVVFATNDVRRVCERPDVEILDCRATSRHALACIAPLLGGTASV